MAFLWNNGPTTKRIGDSNWPKTRVIFTGKDDENYLYKSYVMTRYMAVGAAGFSMLDICVIQRRNPGIGNALYRIKWWAAPLVGGGLVYTSAVQVACSLRGGKTDQWNHFLGGAAAVAVVGKCARCFITGSLTALFLGFVGFIVKDCDMYNMWPIEGILPKRVGGAFHHKYDFTMVKDRQAYWVRTKEEMPKLMERGQV